MRDIKRNVMYSEYKRSGLASVALEVERQGFRMIILKSFSVYPHPREVPLVKSGRDPREKVCTLAFNASIPEITIIDAIVHEATVK
jgi:hypothetical protein